MDDRIKKILELESEADKNLDEANDKILDIKKRSEDKIKKYREKKGAELDNFRNEKEAELEEIRANSSLNIKTDLNNFKQDAEENFSRKKDEIKKDIISLIMGRSDGD